ncbi:O-methyltransferase [Lutispora saccharofermentans]|uniref:tRNA 5-hydroxyuridine methyltransferase n=1 Tax=Lutispora saccharofermentans TaxID=3024236 RepID=A0ABT1NEX3_9FIRM|nr:O-methyltransferase [Lutispora saccharofermentans]MCQ1529792.1 O-methyltransferase [Lutispora saccharofermentans]
MPIKMRKGDSMSNINHDYIQNYINSLLPKNQGILEELEKYAEENHVPIITTDVASLLSILIKSANAKNILEIGTAIGYSSILMGNAMGENFKITTLEKKEDLSELARENIKKSGYEKNITVISGDASEILESLEGIYDIIFVDAAKGQYMDFLKLSFDKLKVGGLFICDNVLFRGMVAERSLLIRRKITIVKRLKKFLSFISDNEALQTVVIPIGDGVSISIKQKEAIIDD